MSREPSPDVPRIDMSRLHYNGLASKSPSKANGSGSVERAESRDRRSFSPAGADNSSALAPLAVNNSHGGSSAGSGALKPPPPSSLPRPSGASVHRSSAVASTPTASLASARLRPQPSLPRPVPGTPKTGGIGRTPAPSVQRATYASMSSRGSVVGAGAGGGAAAAIKASVMCSTMPEGQFSGYGFDTVKYLKEVVRRRDEAVLVRVLPKAQALQQHIAQEECARQLAVQQEHTGRLSIVGKALDDRAKKIEQQTARENKERLDELKRGQQEELAAQKATADALQQETEREVRERLRLVQLLQPKLNPTAAVLADLKKGDSDLALLAELLEEDKRLQKALKADARYNKAKTAEVDGGALSYWLKQCTASSFNVAAILKGAPCRAAVLDAPSVASKAPADRKVLAVRAGAAADSAVVAWAHARVAKPDADAAIAALLPVLGASAEAENNNAVDLKAAPIAEVPAGTAFAGVVWPKESAAAVLKLSRGPKTECGCLAQLTAAALTHDGIAAHELTERDIVAIGEAAAQ